MSAKGLRDLSTGFDAVKAAGGGARNVGGAETATGARDDRRGVRSSTSRRRCRASRSSTRRAPGVVALVGPVIGEDAGGPPRLHQGFGHPGVLAAAHERRRGCSSASGCCSSGSARTRCGDRARSRASRCLVGLGIAIAPLVIGIPGKVDAAVRVTEIGRIGLAPATGQKAVGATALFDGMAADVHTKLEPALDQRLGAGAFAQQFPALANVGRQLAELDFGAVARLERQPGCVRVDVRQCRQDPARADPLDVHHPGLRARHPCRNHAAPGTAHRGHASSAPAHPVAVG